jgi:hypothetical protein
MANLVKELMPRFIDGAPCVASGTLSRSASS